VRTARHRQAGTALSKDCVAHKPRSATEAVGATMRAAIAQSSPRSSPPVGPKEGELHKIRRGG